MIQFSLDHTTLNLDHLIITRFIRYFLDLLHCGFSELPVHELYDYLLKTRLSRYNLIILRVNYNLISKMICKI